MDALEDLLEIAISLTQSVSATDRYDRFLQSIRQLIPCDAASLMYLNSDRSLVPLAAFGLSHKALERSYVIAEHPRLEIICSSDDPVIFPSATPMSDPFDHLLGEDEASPGHVHSCMGSALTFNKKLIGIFTLDALQPGVFDDLDYRFLKLLSALAAAALNTSLILESVERKHYQQQLITQELLRADNARAGNLLGESAAMKTLKRSIRSVAKSDFSVLIHGESGVGKELVARELHQLSKRCDKSLIYVNCAALPENLAESELFGHVKGAFTGANTDRAGKFEVADKGTLFLDEIGELPLAIQAKLLRALQEGEIQRVGQDKLRYVDVRIIAATNRDLQQEVHDGKFRNDLYHRLNVFPIDVPALRERLDDIEILTQHFVKEAARNIGVEQVSIPLETYRLLKSNHWPGNIRELKNSISRAVINANFEQGSKYIELVEHYFDLQMVANSDIDNTSEKLPLGNQSISTLPLRQRVNEFQRLEILKVLRNCDGNWSQTAKALGMDRSNLHNLAKRLGLKA